MKTQMDELRLRVEDSERCLLLSSRALFCLFFSLVLSCLRDSGLCFLALLAPLPHLVQALAGLDNKTGERSSVEHCL